MMEVVSFRLMKRWVVWIIIDTWWKNPLKSRFKILTEVPIPWSLTVSCVKSH